MKKKLEKLFPIFIIVLFIVINIVRNSMNKSDDSSPQGNTANVVPDNRGSLGKGSAPFASLVYINRSDMVLSVPTAPIPNEIPVFLVLNYRDREGDVQLLEVETSDGQKFKVDHPMNYYFLSFNVKKEGKYNAFYKLTDSAGNIFSQKIEFDVVQSKLPDSPPVIRYFENKDIVYLDFTDGLIPNGNGYRKIVVNFNDGSKPEVVDEMRTINRNAVIPHHFDKPGDHMITVNYLKNNNIGGLSGSQDYHIKVVGNINKNVLYPHYAYFLVTVAKKGMVELLGMPQLNKDKISTINWEIKGVSAWSFWQEWVSLFIKNFITHDTKSVFNLKKGIYIVEFEVVDKDGNIGRNAQTIKVP